MAPKIDDREWVERHFAALELVAKNAAAIRPDCIEKVGAWTALKQLAIKNILGVYLPILRNQSWVRRRVYIDTHAGCGVNELRETGRKISGTALLPFAGGTTRFDHYHYIETDSVKREALGERLALFLRPNQYTLYSEPAGESMREIASAEDSLETHHLAVVDPHNMSQIDWGALVQIMEASPGDIVINYPTTEPKRTTAELAETFFGTNEVHGFLTSQTTEQQLLEFFLKRLQEFRPITRTIRINHGETRYHYDLVYGTRKTKGESPFVRAIEEVKRRVERLTGTSVTKIIQSPRLGSFEERPKRSPQTTLMDDFDQGRG